MSGPNPSELGKSQNQENPITRSQVKKNIELGKFVAQSIIVRVDLLQGPPNN